MVEESKKTKRQDNASPAKDATPLISLDGGEEKASEDGGGKHSPSEALPAVGLSEASTPSEPDRKIPKKKKKKDPAEGPRESDPLEPIFEGLLSPDGPLEIDLSNIFSRFDEMKREAKPLFQGRAEERVEVARWTNRIALFRVFDRYVCPVLEIPNPFQEFEGAFNQVINAWSKYIKNRVEAYVRRTRDGSSYRDDFYSYAYMGLLHAIEKQGMTIIGKTSLAQTIAFTSRLDYALQTFCGKNVLGIVSPVKVPKEKPKKGRPPVPLPVTVSLDRYYDDDPYY